MFLDIDHVAISSAGFEKNLTILRQLGHNEVFRELNIDNPKIKIKLMKNYSKQHSLILVKSTGNIGIEFVNYGMTNSVVTYIVPIFENVPDEFCETTNRISLHNLSSNTKLKSFDVPIFVLNSTENYFRFNKILLKTSNINATVSFLQLFGFKIISQTNDLTIVEFRSLLNRTTFNILVQQDNFVSTDRYLDDDGFNCIALISTSAEKDRQLLNKKGIFTTQIEKLQLNNKSLQVFFSRSSCGDIIEIISIENENTS